MATRLDAAYAREVRAVRAAVLNYAGRYWAGLGSYRDEQAALLITKLVPRVEAGQARIGQLTDAYIARLAAQGLGRPISRGPIPDLTTKGLRGVSSTVVYTRPFQTVWTGLARGVAMEHAVQAGQDRLLSIAATGLQLANTHSADNALSRSGVTTYQRVLSGDQSCALCVIASTQQYHTGNLMPIHNNCSCTVQPSFNDGSQPSSSSALDGLRGAVLDRLGSAASSGAEDEVSSTDLRDAIVTHEHGEIGPVLSVRGQQFTSASDLPS